MGTRGRGSGQRQMAMVVPSTGPRRTCSSPIQIAGHQAPCSSIDALCVVRTVSAKDALRAARAGAGNLLDQYSLIEAGSTLHCAERLTEEVLELRHLVIRQSPERARTCSFG